MNNYGNADVILLQTMNLIQYVNKNIKKSFLQIKRSVPRRGDLFFHHVKVQIPSIGVSSCKEGEIVFTLATYLLLQPRNKNGK